MGRSCLCAFCDRACGIRGGSAGCGFQAGNAERWPDVEVGCGEVEVAALRSTAPARSSAGGDMRALTRRRTGGGAARSLDECVVCAEKRRDSRSGPGEPAVSRQWRTAIDTRGGKNERDDGDGEQGGSGAASMMEFGGGPGRFWQAEACRTHGAADRQAQRGSGRGRDFRARQRVRSRKCRRFCNRLSCRAGEACTLQPAKPHGSVTRQNALIRLSLPQDQTDNATPTVPHRQCHLAPTVVSRPVHPIQPRRITRFCRDPGSS